MAQNINQNGNFHTPLSPMRFQSSMGKEVKRKYKDGKNMVRLSLARVVKVNYKYNTVDVVTIQDKDSTVKNPNDNGKFSARLPVQFGGQTPDGKVYGTNTLVTVGSLVLIGYLEGHKDNPIVINIYGGTDNQSMLTRTTFTGADESDEELQQELWQLFTLYPSMTYKNIDGHGNQEVTFPGKTFFYASADDSRVNDAFFDYDHLPSSHYANGDLIEPTSPDAPNMLYVHQSVIDNHRVTFFVKSDGTVRVGSRHPDGKGVTFWQLGTDGSFRIQQSNDTVDPEDKSSNFSSFSIGQDGTISLQADNNTLTIGSNGLLYNGGPINGSSIDLSTNPTIKGMQGTITTIQQATTSDGIVNTVTKSTPWQNINTQVTSKAENFVTQPVPPYNIGDIWKNGSSVYVCTNPKAVGATFSQTDWSLSADVTSQNTAADTANVNGTPASTVVSTASNANSTAQAAQTTAQAKTEMFLSQPTPPYNKGDIWNNNGVMYVSNITRPSGATFLQADWVKSADVTANNTANDTANVNGTPASTLTSNVSNAQSTATNAQSAASTAQSTANTAQSTADGKAKTFTSTPTVPYSLGDMWNQGGKVYSCTTPKSSTGAFSSLDWVLVADLTSANTANDTSNVGGVASSTVNSNISTAQSTANSAQSLATSKAKGFISQPVPPYSQGDVWDNSGTVYICTTSRSTGSFTQSDWTLSGDVTANHTSADTAAVNGTTSSTVISNISTAQSTANSAQTLATSKAKGFISQPVTPYSQGDVWDNSGTVYICTTARSTGSFTQSDWTLSGDVTANNTSADTSAVNGVASATVNSNITSANTAATNAQTTANSKAKTFTTTPTIPYNLGDIYKNGQAVYVCTTARSTGAYTASDFTLVGDVTSQNTANDTSNVNGTVSSTVISNISTAQSTANSAQSLATSKAKGFVTQPTPPYSQGDVWDNSGTVYICTTAKASGGTFAQSDWTLSGDVTANNTAADTAKVNGTASSTVISNISTAQSTANTAQSTANSKAQGFVSQPVPPYNTGDVWNNSGTVYICTTAKASGATFAQADWTLAGDVTANHTSADTSAVNGTTSSTVISNISTAQSTANTAQTTANGKAKTFTSTPTVPYNAGDIYKNGQAVYVCTTARSTGSYTASDFTLVGDVTGQNTAADTTAVNGTSSSTVISNISTAQSTANTANTNAQTAQTTANSKAKGFVAQPTTPYNTGDVWNNGGTVYVCTTARSTGAFVQADWTLAGDVTSNNTAKDTAAVNGTSASTVTSNISNAQSTANNAQTTANSKAQTFTATPTVPYNVGDIYKNGQTVYVCTTARPSGSYTAGDWTLVGDVTANNTAADTAKVNGTASSTVISNISSAQSTANNAQTTANSKAQGFTSQPAPPYNAGDVWNNSGTVYICTTARASGAYTATDWTLAGDVTANHTSADTSAVNGTASTTVISNISTAQSTANTANTNAQTAQTTANSKAQGFTAQPTTPYNKGDVYNNGGTVYICTTARASGAYVAGDWTLAGDVTANNTAADTSKVNGTASSTVISNISNAQSTANTAQSTANSKSKTFTSTPTAPYSVGDIYKNGQAVYIAVTAESTTYNAADWVLAGDVTANNTSADTSKVNGVASATVNSNISTAQSTANTAQSTANSKAQTFTTTPVPPYNLGDIYKNGQAVYVCTTAKASGGTYASGDFTLVGDVTANNTSADTAKVNGTVSSTVISNISTAQSTANNAQTSANSKAKTFTSTPTAPYSVGDLYQTGGKVYVATVAETTAYNAADWVLAGDVTSQNTASDTSNVGGVSSATVNSNISNAQSSANNAQTTANSKAKTFTAQPTIPYSVGDIYQTGGKVYVCTVARSSGSYTASDWTLAGDVTANNTAADTSAVNGTAASTVISNISTAQSTANTAQTTANSKAQTFTSTPVPPYNVGDIYKNGSAVYVCTTAKASGSTYAAGDFVLASDVTANNTAADTAAVNGVASATVNSNITSANTAASNAQTTANSKAKTYTAQPAPPYNTGDVWQSTNAIYICTAGRSSGSYTATDWYKAGDVTSANTAADTSAVNGVASATVNSNISSAQSSANTAQSTANSKAKTWTTQPVPPYSTGDIYQATNAVYICTAGRSTGSYTASDWYKAGDVTSANTANDTANVNGTTSSTVISNISTAQSSANNAQSTANSKAKTWTAQPVPPYSVGDIWQNGGSVYICTTARASGSYTASDWYKAGDVTSANTAADTANVNGTPASTVISNINGAQTTATNAQNAVNSLQVGGRNLLKLSQYFNVYNNFNEPYTLGVDNTQTLYGQPAWKLSMTPDSTHLSDFQNTVNGNHGVMTNTSFTFYANVTYTVSVYWKPISNSDTKVGLTASNMGGWSDVSTTSVGNGWNRSVATRAATSTDKSDYLFFTFSSPTAVAGTPLTAYWACPQLEVGNRATDWNLAPEDTAVIGGRNYLRNTSQLNDLTNWASSFGTNVAGTLNVVNDSVYGGVIDLNVTTNSATSPNWISITNSGLTLPSGKFTVGNTYTLSFLIWNALAVYVGFSDSNASNLVAPYSATIPVNTGWTKIVYTFKATATGNSPVFYLAASDTTHTGHVYVTQVQLEDGSSATGYNPAPEDVQNQISTLNSSVNNIQQGIFPSAMGSQIVNQVTSSQDYTSAMNSKADASALTGLATSTDVANAQSSANDYTNQKIQGIDFSPYVQNTKYTQDKANITTQFTQSGGVNMLLNSVGYNGTQFWTPTLDTGGRVGSTVDSGFTQYGSNNAFSLTGGKITQTVTVTPNVAYTLSAYVYKGSAGTGYMKLDDGKGATNTASFTSGTQYAYQKFSITVTPTTSSLTVTLYGDTASAGLEFGCVILNVGSNPFTWQQHMGEVYNANIIMDLHGIQVQQTDSTGKVINETVMSPDKFAGYADLNHDGIIDTSTGSVDEVFRLDKDTFRMNSATIGPVKIVQTSGTYNGIAFIPS